LVFVIPLGSDLAAVSNISVTIEKLLLCFMSDDLFQSKTIISSYEPFLVKKNQTALCIYVYPTSQDLLKLVSYVLSQIIRQRLSSIYACDTWSLHRIMLPSFSSLLEPAIQRMYMTRDRSTLALQSLLLIVGIRLLIM
jgi:hypothetical protein